MNGLADGGYGAAREGAAYASLDRGLLEAAGPKRVDFLQGMLSNDLAGLNPGQGCRAAVLDVKGHVQTLLRALVSPEAVLLEMPEARLGPIAAFLNRHKVAAPVRFRQRESAVIALLGPRARAVAAAIGAVLKDLAPESFVRVGVGEDALLVAAAGDFPAGGLALHVPRAREADLVAQLQDAGAVPLSEAAIDALRVEEGRAWYGRDVTDENLLHETGQLGEYASLKKGCYVGQEVVARLDARGGNVNKALRGLRLEKPSRSGTELLVDGRVVGRITTAAVSPRLGSIALGYVHRDHAVPGTGVEVDGSHATVTALPFA